MDKHLIIIILASLLWTCQNESTDKDNIPIMEISKGTIHRLENFKSEFIIPRHVDIWVPEGYNKKEKYAVLYIHDGQMLFDSTNTWNKQEWGVDETMSQLIDEKKIIPCIVVGIWNNNEHRHSEYFPQKPFESLPAEFKDSLINDTKRNEESQLFSTYVESDLYLKFIVKELKPYIDKNYSVYTDAKNTFTAGSGMSGLISLYAVCEYLDIFSGAACLSTHWIGTFSDKNNPIPDAFFNYMKEYLPDPANHKIYFDYGTETLDAMYEPFQIRADSLMQLKGFNKMNWETLKFEGADHSEKSWKKRLQIPLTFLLGNIEQST